MTDESGEDDGPLSVSEEWRASIVGLQIQFQKTLLSALIDRGILTGADVQEMMFDLAERLRAGSDQAGTQEVVYYLATMVEKLGNELAYRPPEQQ